MIQMNLTHAQKAKTVMIGAMYRQGRKLDFSPNIQSMIQHWPANHRLLSLCSGRYNQQWARYCILSSSNDGWIFLEDDQGQGRNIHIRGNSVIDLPTSDPFDGLRFVQNDPEHEQHLWLGYLSYDMGRWVEVLPQNTKRDRGWEVGVMHACEGWLVYDMADQSWQACGAWANTLPDWLTQVFDSASNQSTSSYDLHYTISDFVGEVDSQTHEQNVQKTLDYISAGDIFEANIAQRFSASFSGGHMATRGLFLDMLNVSPSWYAGYMECLTYDGAERILASISPELFLEVDQHNHVVTRPIKGTRPAHVDPQELLDSVKDWAELNMVVDMMRNDLGRVCAYRTVRVIQERIIESHPTIHHGVATIEGTLKKDKDLYDLLRSAMPGGSITGAPKVRAMEIIEELESVRRGPYTGGIGLIYQNQMLMNIAIRTAAIEMDANGSGVLDYSVGGGIVADSVPREEFDETLDKMAAMKRAIKQGHYRQY
ncbi:anthranilate synthase component I family protein [Planctomycetota bacterium]|nr:anthranilate synthase component I family protein [Planctomycetota bacterium]